MTWAPWIEHPAKLQEEILGGIASRPQIGRYFKPLQPTYSQEQILDHFRHYCIFHKGPRAAYFSLAKFTQTFAQWGKPMQNPVFVPKVRYRTAQECDEIAGIPPT